MLQSVPAIYKEICNPETEHYQHPHCAVMCLLLWEHSAALYSTTACSARLTDVSVNISFVLTRMACEQTSVEAADLTFVRLVYMLRAARLVNFDDAVADIQANGINVTASAEASGDATGNAEANFRTVKWTELPHALCAALTLSGQHEASDRGWSGWISTQIARSRRRTSNLPVG